MVRASHILHHALWVWWQVSFNTCNICLEEDNISEADER